MSAEDCLEQEKKVAHGVKNIKTKFVFNFFTLGPMLHALCLWFLDC